MLFPILDAVLEIVLAAFVNDCVTLLYDLDNWLVALFSVELMFGRDTLGSDTVGTETFGIEMLGTDTPEKMDTIPKMRYRIMAPTIKNGEYILSVSCHVLRRYSDANSREWSYTP